MIYNTTGALSIIIINRKHNQIALPGVNWMCVCVFRDVHLSGIPIYRYFRDGISSITGIRSPSVYRYFSRSVYLQLFFPSLIIAFQIALYWYFLALIISKFIHDDILVSFLKYKTSYKELLRKQWSDIRCLIFHDTACGDGQPLTPVEGASFAFDFCIEYNTGAVVCVFHHGLEDHALYSWLSVITLPDRAYTDGSMSRSFTQNTHPSSCSKGTVTALFQWKIPKQFEHSSNTRLAG